MKRFKLVAASLALMTIVGCSDARQASIGAWGSPHKITFYPPGGTPEVFHSTGVVENEEHSDGFYFEDKATRKVVRLSGAIKIEVE